MTTKHRKLKDPIKEWANTIHQGTSRHPTLSHLSSDDIEAWLGGNNPRGDEHKVNQAVTELLGERTVTYLDNMSRLPHAIEYHTGLRINKNVGGIDVSRVLS